MCLKQIELVAERAKTSDFTELTFPLSHGRPTSTERYLDFFPTVQIPEKLLITMAPQYAKDQPQGFNNHVKNIAIVGVSLPTSTRQLTSPSSRSPPTRC